MSIIALMGPLFGGHVKGWDTVFFNSLSPPFQLAENKKLVVEKKPGGFHRAPLRRSVGRGWISGVNLWDVQGWHPTGFPHGRRDGEIHGLSTRSPAVGVRQWGPFVFFAWILL